ncbi:MAG: glucose-1-phosphate adenylyltransferase [Actinomycetota bacterium]|nr:glucose-1-phosphate adenylyltransferase [Actinomycetota bacterium]
MTAHPGRERPSVLAIVLAGGRGRRLDPLTSDRAKPAVPFGGCYRIVDFVLSNLANADFRKIVVLTQYKSHSLDRHISQSWRLSPQLGNYVATVPAQMRRGPHWFSGSADAIFQNLNLIRDEQPDHVLVFGADHIYRMDPRQMLEFHVQTGASATVAGVKVPRRQASSFGIIAAGAGGTVTDFLEKPASPPGLPDDPEHSFASMGNYIFRTDALVDAVSEDAADEGSSHDIGGDIVPRFVASGTARVYDFHGNVIPGVGEREHAYWRDVGTLDAYYEAHMDLVSVHPVFNLYNKDWPILTWHPPMPPAKFVFDEDGGRRGHALDSLVSAGVIVAGGTVRRSVLSSGVRVEAGALVEGSVLLDDVTVGPGAVVMGSIVDKQVDIPAGTRIGVDPDADRRRFTVSDKGIAVLAKRQEVSPA